MVKKRKNNGKGEGGREDGTIKGSKGRVKKAIKKIKESKERERGKLIGGSESSNERSEGGSWRGRARGPSGIGTTNRLAMCHSGRDETPNDHQHCVETQSISGEPHNQLVIIKEVPRR